MNLTLSLSRAIAVFPEREAVVDGQFAATYQQLGERVSALCHALLGMNVVTGEVVGIIAPNGHEFLEAYYACAVLGLVLNPINFRLSAREIGGILEDSDARILVAHTDFTNLVVDSIAQPFALKLKEIVWFGSGQRTQLEACAHDYENLIAGNAGKQLPECAVEGSDLAHLYYTSGTTGKSKGVMLTQENVTFHALASVAELSLTDSDTWAHIGPMFHLLDAWAVFACTWAGARHTFAPYFKADEVLLLIEQQKVTITALVPTMLNAMLNEPDIEKRDLTSLRLLLTAGSPIAPEVVKKAVNIFGCDYWQFYGMTETSPFLTISKPKAHMANWSTDRLLNVVSRTGRTFIGVELKIVRPDGSEVEHNDRDVGEIIVRGPSVTQGYWRQPAATANAIENGWLHTGDLAVIDEEGYVNIVDRKKDMIITGGENVYSTEVEYVLYEHPSIVECAVFGIPDDQWGETVKAVVVPKPGVKISEGELIAFVKERLASYKAPRSIEFAEELPKTGSGKIYKKGLREKYWQSLERQVH
ncbi:MAG TPA: long-chain-fatty-acid--CoA ligase [Candidatus Obscuribacterales bacterium]